MRRTEVYLDYAATSPLREEARRAMEPFLREDYGNPSALYQLSRTAGEAIAQARTTVCAVLNCRPNDVIFTSGGTESLNTAIKGVAFAQQISGGGKHIITSSVEHHAVLHSCEYLEKFGFDVTYLGVNEHGLVDLDELQRSIRQDTVLVSIMLANNEVGTIEPIADAARVVKASARALGKIIPFHTDAVQAAGSRDLDVDKLDVDLLSLSAHKFGGPKGVGILFLRRSAPFLPLISGGGQERQRRAGTENVAGIVGAAVALSIAENSRSAASERLTSLRDWLIEELPRRIERVELNGHPEKRLPNNTNFSFLGVEGDALVEALDEEGIAVGSGSACGSGSWEPSHVLLAMGLTRERAAGALRITLGRNTSRGDLDNLLERLPGAVERLRTQPVAAG